MNAIVMGSRSHTSDALPGDQWYQAEPKETSVTPMKNTIQERTAPPTCCARHRRRPAAPTSRNTILEATSPKLGMPRSVRVSARPWYLGSWGRSGRARINARGTSAAAASPHSRQRVPAVSLAGVSADTPGSDLAASGKVLEATAPQLDRFSIRVDHRRSKIPPFGRDDPSHARESRSQPARNPLDCSALPAARREAQLVVVSAGEKRRH